MGNLREIRQVSPRSGLGVVMRVRADHTPEVIKLLGDNNEQCRFYTYFRPAGTPIHFPKPRRPGCGSRPERMRSRRCSERWEECGAVTTPS